MTTTLNSTPTEASQTVRPQRGGTLTKALRQNLGILPVLIGLVVVAVVFQSLNSNFLTPGNMTNLFLQIASTGVMALGVFLILLLGEVDLSIGSVSGMTAAAMSVLVVTHGLPSVLGIIAALVIGLVVGLVHGLIFTRLGAPAFVVTLGGLIGWQGLQLYILGDTGTINLPNGPITALTSTFLPAAIAWPLATLVVVIYAAAQILLNKRRADAGLTSRPLARVLLRVGILAVVSAAAVAVEGLDRGFPIAMIIFVALLVVLDLVTQKTKYGQAIYAVGGNAEAAARAGISVKNIRLSVFMLASMLAAIGGILAASRLFAVGQGSGGGNVLLQAIAAAVIGGTSLFGGRGRAWSALLGILVIGAISNGMDLLGLPSSVKLMITGAVLVAAVLPDSITRLRQRKGR